jgi:hypothetical protein
VKAAVDELPDDGRGRSRPAPSACVRGLAVDYRPTPGGSAGAALGNHIDLDAWTVAVWRSDRAGSDTETPEVAAHATAGADRRRRPPPAGPETFFCPAQERAVVRRAGKDDLGRYPCGTGGMLLAMSIAFSDRTESQ